MSITSDIRSYADTAVSQGKQVFDQSLATAQAQLTEVSGTANQYVGKARENVSDIAEKATGAVNDLRTTAENVINIDALKSAIEPYLTQVKEYRASVTDRAEGVLSGLTNDKRVAKLVDTAGTVGSAVLEQVQDRIVKPVQSITGLGNKTAAKPAGTSPSPARATRPAATKPATPKPASKPSTAKTSAAKTSTTKPTTVKASTTRKAPAKRAPKA